MSIGTVLLFSFFVSVLGIVGLATVHILNRLLHANKITGDYNV